MPDCTSQQIEFEPFGGRRIEANFDGGDVSRDGGVLLVRKLERRLGLLNAVARALADPRDPARIKHELVDMLRQRVFGLVQGYEDLNDHAALRNDVLMQSACERDSALASAPPDHGPLIGCGRRMAAKRAHRRGRWAGDDY